MKRGDHGIFVASDKNISITIGCSLRDESVQSRSDCCYGRIHVPLASETQSSTIHIHCVGGRLLRYYSNSCTRLCRETMDALKAYLLRCRHLRPTEAATNLSAGVTSEMSPLRLAVHLDRPRTCCESCWGFPHLFSAVDSSKNIA
jgi:hypothetical protein